MRPPGPRDDERELRVRLLGELGLRLGDEPLPAPTSSRARSLLAYLVLHAGTSHGRQRLAFLLWPDSSEAQARTNLRNVLHLLRRVGGPIEQHLEVTPTTLCWSAGPWCRVDVAELSAALDRADSEEQGSDGHVAALRDAVDLYAGDLLEDCYDEWIVDERERLRERYVSALRELAQALSARSEHAAAVRVARELLRREPLSEDHHRLLIQVHDRAGDRAGAVRAYHECATVLRHELAVEPSAATRCAYASVMREDDAAMDGSSRPPAQRTALVGRSAELGSLIRSWRAAEEGRSQLVVVTGEPGVGKTRLVEELASWCAHRGAGVARARSYATEGELGFGLVLSWLRSPDVAGHLRRAPPADAAVLARLLPELGPAATTAPAPADETEQRLRLFEAVATALAGTGRPILLVADDAHWSDAASLQLVHFLVRGSPANPLLVVATARSEDLAEQHPLRSLAGALQILDRSSEISLGRLSRAGTAELARHLVGRELDDDRIDHLYSDTEGNALFVVETIRAGWEGQPAGSTMSPKLQAVIASRLAQLSETALHLLGVAATVGRSFTAELVGEAAGVDDLALVRGLDELWRRGMVLEHEGDAYDFSHGKIRDTAYASLSPVVRRRNHLRVAEALQRLAGADADAVSGQVAVSYQRAGRPSEAVDWYRRAAVHSLGLHAAAEAVGFLERARDLVPSVRPADRPQRELEVLSMLPTALGGVEGFTSDRLADVQRRAVELANELGVQPEPPLLRSLVMSALCRDEFAEARAAADRLRTSARAAGDDGLAMESEYLLGIAAFWAADLEAARGHFERVVECFRPEQRSQHLLRFGQDPQVVCLSRLANVLWFLGHEDEARSVSEDASALAQEASHPFSSDVARAFAAMLAVDLEDHELLAEHVAGFGERRERSRVLEIHIGGALEGYARAVDGHAEEGVARIRAAIEAAGGRNLAPGFRPTLLRLLVAAYDLAGDPEAGLATTDEALHLGGTRLWEPEVRRLRAGFLAALGHPPGAVEAELARAASCARRHGAIAQERRIQSSRDRLEARLG